jgi:hypothetical protein
MSSRYLAHYEPSAAPPPSDALAPRTAVAVPIQDVLAYVYPMISTQYILFALKTPPDRLSFTIAITPDYPYYMEV